MTKVSMDHGGVQGQRSPHAKGGRGTATVQAVWKEGTLVLSAPFSRPTNVSSVPMYSPFRYPGGKTWLVPTIRRWLASLDFEPEEMIEPFAGGGSIGLTCAFERLTAHTTLVEFDPDVAAIWEVMLGPEGRWLADRVRSFEFCVNNVDNVLSQTPTKRRERAFATLLKNRVNRGGILAEGAGRSKYGEKGKGIASRWYPKTLSDRILAINSIKDRLHFIRGDGLTILQGNASRRNVVFFIDPPYTAAGKKAGLRLYPHSLLDHEKLFSTTERVKGDFLMTYDDTREVEEMALRHHFRTARVPMKSTHHATMTELLVGRDLGWAAERTLNV